MIVNVSDRKDAAGNEEVTPTIDDTIALTITVGNLNERGTVTFEGTESGGETLTASVTDPDGSISGLTWSWAREATATGTLTDDPSMGTSASYTTVAADVGTSTCAPRHATPPVRVRVSAPKVSRVRSGPATRCRHSTTAP